MIAFENTAEGLVVAGAGFVGLAHVEQQIGLLWLGFGSLGFALSAIAKRS